MKDFIDLDFDPKLCKSELDEFGNLLAGNKELAERKDIQPFFEARHHLSAFLGTFAPNIVEPNKLSFQFPIFGDFATDIAVGDSNTKAFCFIEFEDASVDGIFAPQKGRATKEWGRRFEHGFSQLVDWFFSLDDHKDSKNYTRYFGYGHVDFVGLLIIGRSTDMTDFDKTRLRWRTNKVLVNSNPVHCLTFDDLYDNLNRKYQAYSLAYKGKN